MSDTLDFATDKKDAFAEVGHAVEMGCMPSVGDLHSVLHYLDQAEHAINPWRHAQGRYARLFRLDDERAGAAMELLMNVDAIEEALGARAAELIRTGQATRLHDLRKHNCLLTVNLLQKVPQEVWQWFTLDLWRVWELQVETALRRVGDGG